MNIASFAGLASLCTVLLSSCDSGGSTDSGAGNGTDRHGFRVLPAGRDRGDGQLGNIGCYAHFWSTSQMDGSTFWSRIFHGRASGVYRDASYEMNRFSLRRLKD